MRALGINQVAVLAALGLHALLLSLGSASPPPSEAPLRISLRLRTALAPEPIPAPASPVAAPAVAKPRPSIEKVHPNQPPPRVVAPPAPTPQQLAAPAAAPVAVATAPEPAAPEPAAAAAAAPEPGTPAPPDVEPAEPRPAASPSLGEYLRLVREAVELNKDYPAFARQLGQQGTALVQLRIDRDGRLLQAVILSSSGHPSLDKAALAAARKAGRFRPPAAYGLDEIEVEIPIAYKLI